MKRLPPKKRSKKKKTLRDIHSKVKEPLNPLTTLKKYKEAHKDSYKLNVPQQFSVRTRKGKMDVMLVPASWKLVLLYAAINAVLIFMARIVWFDIFGKPSSSFLQPSYTHHDRNFPKKKAMGIAERSGRQIPIAYKAKTVSGKFHSRLVYEAIEEVYEKPKN